MPPRLYLTYSGFGIKLKIWQIKLFGGLDHLGRFLLDNIDMVDAMDKVDTLFARGCNSM
jgi:hypothetical protein